MTRANLTVTVDSNVLQSARALKLPLSNIVEDALRGKLNTTSGESGEDSIDSEIAMMQKSIEALKERKSSINREKIEHRAKELSLIEDFKQNTAWNVTENQVQLEYWSKKTGRPIQDLIDIKKGKLKE